MNKKISKTDKFFIVIRAGIKAFRGGGYESYSLKKVEVFSL